MKRIAILFLVASLVQSLQASMRLVTSELPQIPAEVVTNETPLRLIELSCRCCLGPLQLEDWLWAGVDACPMCGSQFKQGSVLYVAIMRNDISVIEYWFQTHEVTLDAFHAMQNEINGNSLVMTATESSHEATLECLLRQLIRHFGAEATYHDVLTMPNNEGKRLIHLLVECDDRVKREHLRRAGLIVSKDFDDILAYAHEIYRADPSKIEEWATVVARWRNNRECVETKVDD
ncbi:hypothetical protein FJ365_00300 [Candidatus Dependentiae bacterium]|nr:hypothetical protein [Candidatus Dependentiae bacterium]